MKYRIMAEKRNWMIAKRVMVTNKKTGEKSEQWKDLGIYCARIEHLAESLLQFETRQGVMEGKAILDAIKAAKQEVLDALKTIGIEEATKEVVEAARAIP